MLSLHPIHLIPDKKGQLPPSALVPFCSYQGESNMLGQKRPVLDNLTICDKFDKLTLKETNVKPSKFTSTHLHLLQHMDLDLLQ